EDGHVGANPQCQREDGHRRESRGGCKDADGMAQILLNPVTMLPEGRRNELDERGEPDDNGRAASGAVACVAELIGERTKHLPAVLLTELRRIAPQQRAVKIWRPHVQGRRGIRPVARAWLRSSLTRRASAAAA